MTDTEEIWSESLHRIGHALFQAGLSYSVRITEIQRLANRKDGTIANCYHHERKTKVRIECDQLAVIFRNHPMGVEIKPYASGDRSWNLWRLDPTKEEIINWSNWSLAIPK